MHLKNIMLEEQIKYLEMMMLDVNEQVTAALFYLDDKECSEQHMRKAMQLVRRTMKNLNDPEWRKWNGGKS